MTEPDLRRALDDAKETSLAALLFLDQDNPSTRALPNMKAVLRFAAKLHREYYWPGQMDAHGCWQRVCDYRADNQCSLSEAIAASPEWRAAWLKDTGIDYKEIDHA